MKYLPAVVNFDRIDYICLYAVWIHCKKHTVAHPSLLGNLMEWNGTQVQFTGKPMYDCALYCQRLKLLFIAPS